MIEELRGDNETLNAELLDLMQDYKARKSEIETLRQQRDELMAEFTARPKADEIDHLRLALREAVALRVSLWRNGDLEGDDDKLTDEQVAKKDHYAKKWIAMLPPTFERKRNMTINEAIEHADAQAYKCHGTECGNEHAELARWLRELRARRETGDSCGRQCEGTAYRIELLRLQREMPDLSPVIAWLENGCDPKEAAKELRIYQQRMRSNA